jgi:hypothetical protein
VAIAAAGFPEITWATPKRSAQGLLTPVKTREHFDVSPLHQIQSREARRAAVEILVNRARNDRDEMRSRKIKEILDSRAKRSRRTIARIEQNPICRVLQCSEKKREFETLFGSKLTTRKGKWNQIDQTGGSFFVCAACARVKHSTCDGIVATAAGDACYRCARENRREASAER